MKIYFSLITLFLIFSALEAKKDKDGVLEDNEFDAYTKFLAKNKKSCGDDLADCKARKSNFAKNLKKYNEIKKTVTFETQMHPNMDWSEEELKKRLIPLDVFFEEHTGKKKNSDKKNRAKRLAAPIPSSYDWRLTGAVPDVKDQGDCGDCWAFATTGAIEILDNLVNCRINPDSHVSYSDQLVTDCTYYNSSLTQSQQRDGCGGGSANKALNLVISKGITLESSNPFISGNGNPGVCPATFSPKVFPIKDQMDLTEDIPGMLNYVATYSPITVALLICDDFEVYKSGIYNNLNCNAQTSKGGHVVVVIGYGTENGVDYWLCRNSWSSGWGDAGYIKIQRGVDIATVESRGVFAPIPTVPADKCTVSLDYYYDSYPTCTCTAPAAKVPTSPFATQTKPGINGCIPSNYPLNCNFNGTQALTVKYWDDLGNLIESINYCSTNKNWVWTGKCETVKAAGSNYNYPTLNGVKVAYRTCTNISPQSWCT